MGSCSQCFYFIFLFWGCILSALLAIYISITFYPSYTSVPEVPDIWWGKGQQRTKDNLDIVPFKVDVPNEVLVDLKTRLSNTKYSDPLEGSQFEYGFNSDTLKEVVKYWKDSYDWRKIEKELNQYKHFKTQIDGIDIHFVRHKAANIPKGVEVVPIILIHGWPGSFYEFYKSIPELTKHRQGSDFVLEVIVPSIPGYGFSEEPHKQGFSAVHGAKIFHKLMTRLGFEKYYIQGGDWGGAIGTGMAIFYPNNVLAIHTQGGVIRTVASNLKLLMGSYFPQYFYDKEEIPFLKPIKGELMFMLKEIGYLMLQATKPDTVGSGLEDSPAGLAAYILEKFATQTDRKNIGKKDGGLTEKFTMDELLTNVMIYWVTGSITSSQRLYKETITCSTTREILLDFPIKVPSGIIIFPEEMLVSIFPKNIFPERYQDLVSFSRMPRGGHYGAFEEPQLFSADLLKFVTTVRNRPNNNKNGGKK